MMNRLASSVACVLLSAILRGGPAFVGWPTAAAQQSDSAGPAGTTKSDQAESVGATPIQGNQAGQPALDPLAQRIRFLHERLGVTPAQEPLWANLVQVMRENANAVTPLLKLRFQTAKNGTAIDSLVTYEKLTEAQLDGLRKFIAAFQALYNGLSDSQKKVADVLFLLPRLPEPLVAPYAYYPPPATSPVYPTYPYYPLYSYYPYYNSLLLSSPLTVAPFFFFHHHAGLVPPRTPRAGLPPAFLGVPPVHAGIPLGRVGVMHPQLRIR